MATFAINETARRTQFTSTGQTSYAFNFQVNAQGEVQVFKNDTLQTLTTHYTVSLNTDGTGTISFTSSHIPSSGDIITIIGDLALSRTTTLNQASDITTTNLDTEFDNVVIRQQQIKEITDRSIQLKPSTPRTVTGSGTSGPLQFPYDGTASNNANRIVKFDSNGTALELGSTTTNIDALAGIASDISTVSGISSNVTSVASNASNINTVAGSISNVNALGAISSDVTSVAGIASNVTTVAGKASLITSDFAADMSLVTSDFVTDMSLVTADFVSDVNTLATSDIVTDLNLLATSDFVSDLNSLATSDFVSDLNALEAIKANVTTVASNIADVNNFASVYRVGSSDPSSSLDEGDLFYNSTDNILKFYNGSSWVGISDASSLITVADESSDTSCNILFTTAATGNLAPKSGTNLTFNSSSGALTATSFVGDVTGNVTGNTSGSSGSCTGNSATATALETARNIGGVSFDGTGNIDLPGVNTSGNQNTSGTAATATALETARNIGGVSFDGTGNIDLPGVNSAGNQNTSGTAAGLSATLAVGSGGTGATSLTANGVLIGNGTSAVTAVDMSTKGSLLAGDGSGNPSTLGVGTNDFVLTADSSESTGLKWAAIPSASVPTQITVADESSDTTCFPLFATAATGDIGPKTGSNLAFNSSSGLLTATGFAGALTGNASTATALETARNIGGVSFDGTGNIDLPGVNAGPSFSARISSNQSVSASTFTKMQCATEDWDTDSKYDASTNFRFTPTVAGYYQFNLGMRGSSATINIIALYKNGAIFKRKIVEGHKYAALSILAVSDTDDYFEAFGFTSGTTFDATDTNNWFQAHFVRGA